MTLWRPPRTMSERTARAVRSMQNGSMDGHIVSAQPVKNSGSVSDESYIYDAVDDEQGPDTELISEGLIPFTEQFTGTDERQVFPLKYNPVQDFTGTRSTEEKYKVSVHVYWNGVLQEDLRRYRLIRSEITNKSYIIFNDSSKLKASDTITIKYWFADAGDDGRDITVGTWIKRTGSLGTLSFWAANFTPPRVGTAIDTGVFEAHMNNCSGRNAPAVTIGVTQLSGETIPVDEDTNHSWYFTWDYSDLTLAVMSKRIDAPLVPCSYTRTCRRCCGFGFSDECRSNLRCLDQFYTPSTEHLDPSAARRRDGSRLVLTGDEARDFSKRVVEGTAEAQLRFPGWGASRSCVCTMFGTCVDGSVWGRKGTQEVSLRYYLGATLVVTREGQEGL